MSDFFTEVPTVGKHKKIEFQGYLLTYDRANPSGKKYYRCTKSYCKVIYSYKHLIVFYFLNLKYK